MNYLFISFFFILGLVIGSFLNVVIYRFNTNKMLKGRSACMACRHKLSWYELIPLFSFFYLRGRCKICQTRISKVYPIVEFITGIVFTGLLFKFYDIFSNNFLFFSFTYIYYAVIFSFLIVITIYDLKHKIIPDILSLFLGILTFLGIFFFDQYSFSIHLPTLWQLLAGPLMAIPFALFWLVSKGAWMGLGDAKLTVSLGWLLGISGAISAFVISFWSGAIVGITLILFSRKYGMKSEIPFAPFLIFGTVITFFLDLYIFPFF